MDDIIKLQETGLINLMPPVHTLEAKESSRIFIGQYLMTHEDPVGYMKKFLDEGFTIPSGNAVMFFETRHLYELLPVIYGIYSGFIMADIMTEAVCLDISIHAIKTARNTPRYSDLRYQSIKYLNNYPTDKINNAIKNKISQILKYIWFMPYKFFDDTLRVIIDEAKKAAEPNG